MFVSQMFCSFCDFLKNDMCISIYNRLATYVSSFNICNDSPQ
jgi:hypothetical protein